MSTKAVTNTIDAVGWSPAVDDWDAADGGISVLKKRNAQQRAKSPLPSQRSNSSPRAVSRDAASWFLPNSIASPSKGSVSSTLPHSPSTPLPQTRKNVTPNTVNSTPNQSNASSPASSPAVSRASSPATETSASSPTTPSKKKFDGPIPVHFIQTIHSAFGKRADLFSDVLMVARDANPREIRIAYFRRGREVLSEGNHFQSKGVRPKGSAVSVGHSISSDNKLRFQAVSMTYEIVKNPRWLEAYESGEFDKRTTPVVTRASPVPTLSPLLRRNTKERHRRSRSQNAVRWKEEVEELVFDHDPIEHAREPSRRPKRKGGKKRVVVDGGELEDQLDQLDREAEKERNFTSSFLDHLEASIEEMLSLSGSKKKSKRQEPNLGGESDEDSNYSNDSGRESPVSRPTSPTPLSGTDNGRRSPVSRPRNGTPLPTRDHGRESPVSRPRNGTPLPTRDNGRESPLSRPRNGTPLPTRDNGRESPNSRQRKGMVLRTGPNGRDSPMPQPRNPVPVPNRSSESPVDYGKASPTSFFEEKEEPFNPVFPSIDKPTAVPKETVQKPVCRKLAFEFEEIEVPTKKSVAGDDRTIQSNSDTLSTLSMSFSDRKPSNPATVVNDLGPVQEDREDGSVAKSGPEENLVQKRDEGWLDRGDFNLGCDSWCGPDESEVKEVATAVAKSSESARSGSTAGDASRTSEATEDGDFHIFLISYLKSFAEDLYKWTSSSLSEVDIEMNPSSFMKAMTLSEGDLEGMLGILRKESTFDVDEAD